ncbi:hypothetical protein [uncultured Clostridium sp.]|uniref:hypothetical protein n=1 Tax=uncultured Clostridium sp. TaxID=59620 RepID=UPI00262968C1|nr:hypothetical protein [uncultured Clostridium sp.]
MIERVSDIDFILDVRVKINNVEEAFTKYKSKVLRVFDVDVNIENEKVFLDNRGIYEDSFISFMKRCYRLNKDRGMIFDFYTNRLDGEVLEKIKKELTDTEVILFNELVEMTELRGKYFKVLNIDILEILVKLCIRELFFITFYLLDDNITIWGNYNMKFPIFYNNDTDIQEYVNVARDNKLFL